MPDFLRLSLPTAKVGHLRSEDGRYTFLPDPEWAADRNRPVLGQRFEDNPERRIGASGRLPSWFSNLLPEGQLRTHVARTLSVSERSELRLFEALGRDLPGALVAERVTDMDVEDGEADVIEEPVGVAEEVLKFSLAGVQVKFSASVDEDRGVVVPVRGSTGEWILKLPAPGYREVPANEFTMMRWAQAGGLHVPEVRLLDVSSVERLPRELPMGDEPLAYAVRRFDRVAGRRIHIEDFAQVLDVYPERKYEGANYTSLLKLTHATADEDSVRELLGRLVAIVAMGNGDAHLKNWSFIYVDGRSARLSPAYDLVCTTPYIPNEKLALSLGGSKDLDDVTLRRFERMLDKAGLPEPSLVAHVAESAERLADAWQEVRELDECPSELRQVIDDRLRQVPLFRV